MQYEINFLVLQSKTEDLEKIRTEIKSLIEKYKGKINDQLFYQKRKLAYEIKKERYGFYSVFRFEISNKLESLKELKTELNLNHSVARYLIVRADDLPALQKKELTNEASPSAKNLKTTASTASKTESASTEKVKLTKKSTTTKENQTLKEAKTTKVEAPVKPKEKVSIEEEVIATLDNENEVTKNKTEIVAKEKTENKELDTEKTEPEEKSAELKPEKKEEIKRRPAKKQASLEDLDKKLDEILDI